VVPGSSAWSVSRSGTSFTREQNAREKEPTLKALDRIATALSVTLSELFD